MYFSGWLKMLKLKDIQIYDAQRERDLLQGVLRQSEADPDLAVVSVESTPACAVGDNFMSAVTRLVVSVETVKRYSTKKCFLMKRQLASRQKREAMRCDPAFRNEASAYQVVVPALEHFSNVRLPFPECLHATNECLVLADLKQDGFRMANKKKGLNFLQASLALKELGKFHGTSLAMKLSDPKQFNKVKSGLLEFLFVPNSAPGFGAMLENALNVAIFSLKNRCDRDKTEINPIINKLEHLRGSLFQKLFQIVCPKGPLSLLCHGDFYVNNMLFRDNEMGIPEEVAFVDLQGLRHSTPATDILCFFGTSLENGLLLSQHNTLFEIYYQGLSEEMLRSAPNAEKISLEMIKEEVKNNALYGLVMGFLVMQAVTLRPDSVDTNKEPGIPTVEETLEYVSLDFFDRIADLAVTFEKLGYL